jgi:hypothetical protein
VLQNFQRRRKFISLIKPIEEHSLYDFVDENNKSVERVDAAQTKDRKDILLECIDSCHMNGKTFTRKNTST